MDFESLIGNLQDQFIATMGEACTHLPQVGSPQAVHGVFSSTSTEIDPINGIVSVSPRPRLGIKLSEFTVTPTQGDQFTIRSAAYKVTSVEPDGEGWAEMSLHRL